MAAVTIRKLPDEVLRALKIRAALHGRSTEAEIRDILEEAAQAPAAPATPAPKKGLATALAELGREFGGVDLDIERDKTPAGQVSFE